MPPIARHGRLPTSHAVLGLIRVVAIVAAVAVASSVSIAGVAAYQLKADIGPGVHLETLPGKTAQAIPDVGAIEGGVNLLLVGTDTRLNQVGFQNKADLAASSGAGNNDVTMLLHISEDHSNATVISFPRDLIVTVPKCGNRSGASNVMFNTTLSRGGLSCTVLTVESMTGLSIPFAAEISFDGVVAMSNAVGGVSVCLATPVVDKYVQLNLPAGQQTLVGQTALAFVRSRHGVGDGSDIGRISNQQVFLSALMRKIASAEVLSNPLTLYKLANAAVVNMQLSDGLTRPTTLVSVALALKGIPLSAITFLQYPTTGDPANPNRVVAITSAASVLNAALRADQRVTLTGQVGRGAVLEPGASPAPSASSTAPVPSGSATPEPTASASTPAAVALPATITGQTADQQTCTKGNQ